MTPEAIAVDCGCGTNAPRSETTRAETPNATAESPPPRARPREDDAPPKIEDLIPIAVVIAAGCEPCAERMVRRAVDAGSARRHVLRAIAIVADLRERECFRKNIAPEVVERMKAPLQRARNILDELTVNGAGASAP